jgi:hypothetical protein
MSRHLRTLVIGVAVLFPAVRAHAEQTQRPESNIVTVPNVQGEGTDRESALRDALRKALEIGGKQFIASQSEVKDYVLIRDTIYSHAEGIVTDYKVLSEKPGLGGTVVVTITAKVDRGAITNEWGRVKILLQQIGRPKVMVYIQERIDGRLSPSSILESKIEERLMKSGFELVAKTAMEDIAKKESKDAAADDDVKKVQAIAKNFHAQVYIVGHANANAAGITDAYGVSLAMYNCDAEAKVYYTDTGRLLASESLPQTRGGAQGRSSHSPQAGKQALSLAGEGLVQKLYDAVMKKWSIDLGGGGELVLEVSGLKYAQANKLKKMLMDMAEVIKAVNMRFSKGIATYELTAKCTGEDLGAKLSEDKEMDKLIEIVDVTLNRIQAKAKGGGE